MNVGKVAIALTLATVTLSMAPAAQADSAPWSGHGVFLAHATQSSRVTEKGVLIYRGGAPEAAPELAGGDSIAPAAGTFITINNYRYPPRRLRSQGFWSGTGFASRRFTHGFFADRVGATGGRAQR